MFIVWKGFGILVPIVGIGSGLLAVTLIKNTGLIMGSGMLIGSIILWFLGIFFEKYSARNARQLVDPKTNQPVLLKKEHDFFFIPIKWWAIPCSLLAFYLIWEDIGKKTPESDSVRTHRAS